MTAGYLELLDATVRHLENLQAQGVRNISVAPETLRALAAPAVRAAVSAVPLGAQPPVPAAPVIDAKPLHPAPIVPMPKPVTTLRVTQVASPDFVSADPQKAAAFVVLRDRVQACVQCPNLAASRHNIVFGVGNIDSPLMFVGEAPGADEDEQGEPFVGKAGQLLTKIIETMALKRGDVYIANILKCRPDTPGQAYGNRKPTPDEMATCIPYLHEQIDLIKPKVLVALGATAVEGLLGKTGGITKLRGNWQTYRGIPLMPTYHPAYLLRNQALSEKRRVWEDMLQVMEKLGLPITERQRSFFTKG